VHPRSSRLIGCISTADTPATEPVRLEGCRFSGHHERYSLYMFTILKFFHNSFFEMLLIVKGTSLSHLFCKIHNFSMLTGWPQTRDDFGKPPAKPEAQPRVKYWGGRTLAPKSQNIYGYWKK